ncbi:hypothetical protein MYX84_06830 [Acidobacteria bacterium AH-259-O06]|nr:hypothetical protein [Acidobacteria bacterium AH-259-O06]
MRTNVKFEMVAIYRDKIYGNYFRQRVKGMGIEEVLTANGSWARSAENAWTMLWYSMKSTCEAF